MMKTFQKEPVIRSGQRRPYHKGTHRQIRRRIRVVAELLRLGARKWEIHRIIKKRFAVQWRQCDRYIATARAQGTLPANSDNSSAT